MSTYLPSCSIFSCTAFYIVSSINLLNLKFGLNYLLHISKGFLMDPRKEMYSTSTYSSTIFCTLPLYLLLFLFYCLYFIFFHLYFASLPHYLLA